MRAAASSPQGCWRAGEPGGRRSGDGRRCADGAAVARGSRGRRGDADCSGHGDRARAARAPLSRRLLLRAARRRARARPSPRPLAVVWIDAHGDLTRPTRRRRATRGHAVADADRRGDVDANDVTLLGARSFSMRRGELHRGGRYFVKSSATCRHKRSTSRRPRRDRPRLNSASSARAGGLSRRAGRVAGVVPTAGGAGFTARAPRRARTGADAPRARARPLSRRSCNRRRTEAALKLYDGETPDRRPGRAQARSARVRREAPEYVPQVRRHFRDDELETALWVCGTGASLRDAGPRADRVGRRRGLVVEEAADVRS